jgi:uncharacterized protein with NAD-binding domain and iron-sulfur cluster
MEGEMAKQAKQRIAILGGGMAALTAAYEITRGPTWRDQFDVTVYQLGWRLGGKCASGRNARDHQRIEEHGLHILLGFYENAFRLLKGCYHELDRPAGSPLATWQDAFKPHNYVVLMQKTATGHVPWSLDFPPNDEEPGTGHVVPKPFAMIEMIFGWLKQLIKDSDHLSNTPPELDEAHGEMKKHSLLDELRISKLLHALQAWLHDQPNQIDPKWLRTFVTIDLAIAAIKGMILDGVILPPHDYFKLDNLDFRAWLSKHGARPCSVNSAFVQGMYDLGFSTEVGAGTALLGILRMVWTYKGAVMWKMQAGMGDAVFAPLYEVLRKRGVKFEFFQRVDKLELTDDKRQVARVIIGQQATVKAGSYQPLVDVKGLPCWPSEPDHDQLVEGKALHDSGENLEDWSTAWPDPAPPRVLELGADGPNGFDKVILGCSVAMLPYIAGDLIAASAPLANMVAGLKTTQTQALQLWMSRALKGLGWHLPSPVLDGFAKPMDTWADMTHLVSREDWQAGQEPKHIAYLCSRLEDFEPMPPRSVLRTGEAQPEHGYVQRQTDRVHALCLEWLNKHAVGLWPAAGSTGESSSGLDWSLLIGSAATETGTDRLASQYWLATLNPSDRYVLAVPNSVDKRIKADGAGFDNLVLAGDYLRTALNVGCIEAATMAGLHASRAICGWPEEIIGDET